MKPNTYIHPPTQRHLLKRIGAVLREDRYIPEAEAVFDREMKIYADILESKPNYWRRSDYLILKFSEWFSDFGKSIWRPLIWILVAGVVGYTGRLWATDSIIWWTNPFNKNDVEGLCCFIFEVNLIELIKGTGWVSIGIVAVKAFIAYSIYNFLRATRRFNSSGG